MLKHKQYTVIAFAPGSTMNYVGCEGKLLKGLTEIFGNHIPIIGGSAADGAFRQTYQFKNGEVYKDGLVTLTLSIYLENNYSTNHAYKPTDKTAFINESKDKLVLKMNNSNPLAEYSKLIKVPEKELEGPKISYVGVKNPFGMVDINGKYWIRSPQAAIKEGVLFFTDIPKHSTLTLMKPNPSNSINCAEKSLKESSNKLTPSFSVVFDCVGRKTLLGKEVKKEVDSMKKTIKDTPLIGFYTFGEYGFDLRNPPNLVNGTVVSFSVSNKMITEQ